MATPRTISRGIHRLLECEIGEEGVPNSDRIIHDVDLAWESMMLVYQQKGAIIENRVNRNGDRYSKSGTGKCGGYRIKGELAEEKWLDPGARQAKIDEQQGREPPTYFSDDSDNDSILSDDVTGGLN